MLDGIYLFKWNPLIIKLIALDDFIKAKLGSWDGERCENNKQA